MSKDIADAVRILKECLDGVRATDDYLSYQRLVAFAYLSHAISHISRPERSVYPKVRNATKRNPVTRVRST